jgi:serine/threonine protein kinase
MKKGLSRLRSTSRPGKRPRGRGKRPPEFKPGQKVDDFRIEKLLGGGQDGEVWQATKVSMQRVCALKFLNSVEEQDKRGRFEQEIEILSRLNSPYIVSILDKGEAWNPTSGRTVPYYAMDFVSGLPIKKALEEIPDGERLKVLCRLFEQVLSALEEVHLAGLSHGDIKSTNILVLVRQRIAKLSDFGFGSGPGEQRRRKEYPPSSYRAPMQLGPVEADLYRLGRTLEDCMQTLPASLLPSAERTLRGLVEDLTSVPPGISEPDAIQILGQIQVAADKVSAFGEKISANVPELAQIVEGPSLVRLPLQGVVPLTKRVRCLLDAEPFQRTRRIREFPSPGLVYPGVSTTKFEVILAEAAVLRVTLMCILEDEEVRDSVTGDHLNAMILAGLVRRLGELPYEPLLEEAIPTLRPLDQRSLEILHSSPLNSVVATHWRLDSQMLLDVLLGGERNAKMMTWNPLFWLLVHPLSPPNLERMRRLAFMSGIQPPDMDRYCRGLTLTPIGGTLALRDTAVANLENILLTAFAVQEQVLRHHTVRAADLMLVRAFAELSAHGIDPTLLPSSSEEEFLLACLDRARRRHLRSALRFVEQYRNRRLFKTALVIDPEAEELGPFTGRSLSIEEVGAMEHEAAQALHVNGDDILLDVPSRLAWTTQISVLSGTDVVAAEDYSPLYRSMRDQMRRLASRITLFCSPELKSGLTSKKNDLVRVLRDRTRQPRC